MRTHCGILLLLCAPAVSAHLSDIEPPDFNAGLSIDGQGGWLVPETFDEVVTSGVDGQFWRISNAITNEQFGSQPHSPPAEAVAGESAAVPASGYNALSTSFDFWSHGGLAQAGLSVTNSADEGNGGRVYFFDIEDFGSGLEVRVVDYDGFTLPDPFISTTVATALSYDGIHRIRVDTCFVDGPPKVGIAAMAPGNDTVRFYVDGSLVHSATSLEQFYIDNPSVDLMPSCLADQTEALACAGAAGATAGYVAALESTYSLSVPMPQGATEICSVLPQAAEFPFPGEPGSFSNGARLCVLECEQAYWSDQAGQGACTAGNYGNLDPLIDPDYNACLANCDQAPWGVDRQLFRVSNAAVPGLSGGGLGIDNVETFAFDQSCADPQVDLAVDIGASYVAPLLPGDDVVLNITMDNLGDAFASGVSVTATLPSELSYVADSCGAVVAGPAFSWNIGESGPNGAQSAHLECDVTVNINGGVTGSVTTEVAVVLSETDVDLTNNSDSVSFLVASGALPIPLLSWPALLLLVVIFAAFAASQYRRQAL